MAKTVSDLLRRVKKVLEDSQQNIVGNLRSISNSETRSDWARPITQPIKKVVEPIKVASQNAWKEFSENPKTMGKGIGTAIKAPFELARLNKEAETTRRLQQTLNNQSNRQLKAGNIDRARKLSEISVNHGENQANQFKRFGDDVKQGISDTVAGTIGTGIQLFGAKGASLKDLAKYAGISGGIGGGVNKLTGGSFAEGFGSGVGNSLSYRGVNKLTQPSVDKIVGKTSRVPLKTKIAVSGGANALANIIEDEILSRVKGQAPTNKDRLASGAIGFGIGASGPVGGAVLDKAKDIKTKFKQMTGEYAPSRLGNKKIPLKQEARGSLKDLLQQPRSKNGQYGGWTKEQMLTIRTHPDFNKANLSPKLRKMFNEFDFKYQNPRGNWAQKENGGFVRQQLQPAYGAVAGLEPEKDENGNIVGVKVDPKKAIAGIALMGGIKAVKNGDLKFDGNYSRGDIKTLQTQLDDILGTKSFNVSGKWQADLPARQSAKDQIEHYAKQGDVEAKKLLERVSSLEDQILKAQSAKPTGKVPLSSKTKLNSNDFEDASDKLVADAFKSVGQDPSDLKLSKEELANKYKVDERIILSRDLENLNKKIKSYTHYGAYLNNDKNFVQMVDGLRKEASTIQQKLDSLNNTTKSSSSTVLETDPVNALKHQIGDTFKLVEPVGDLWKSRKSIIYIKPNQANIGYLDWLRSKNFIKNAQEAGNNIYKVEVDKSLFSNAPSIKQVQPSTKESTEKQTDIIERAPLINEAPVQSGFTPVSKVIEQKGKVRLKKTQLDPSDPRLQDLDHLMNDGSRLMQMGYSKAQVDKIGANEARRIIEENIPPYDYDPSILTKTSPKRTRTPMMGEFEPQIGNTPKRITGNKYSQFDPTQEEVDYAKAQSYYNEIQQSGLKRWFNKVFDPLKNAPKEVQEIMQDWRNENMTSRVNANEVAQEFTDIPEKDGWKLIQYIQNPTNRSAYELDLDINKYQPQISRLRQFYDATRQEGLKQGLEINYLDNYLNQIWKETPNQINAKIKAGAGKNPGFTKERFIPTYQEGVSIGLTPRYTHPAQLVAHYKLQLDKALANRKMADRLIESELLLPSSKAPIDWRAIESPFFPKVKLETGVSDPIVMDYKAPPDIANAINNIFEVREPGLLSKMAKLSKGVQEFALSAGIPKTPINSFTLANMQKEILAGRVKGPFASLAISLSDQKTAQYFKENQQTLKDMASEGIPVFTNTDFGSMYKNLAEKKNFWQNLFGGTKDVFDSWFNEPTFKRFMPVLQTQFYKDAYEGALKDGIDATQAKRIASEATKNFYGLTDAFSRPAQTEEILSAFVMAPRFREAMMGFWGKTIKSIDPRTFSDKAFSVNRKFIVGAGITWALYNIMNKQSTGRWMFENKDGKELSLEIPIGGGRSFYLPFLFTIGTVPRRFIEAGGELAGGDIAGATQKMTSFASIPVNALSMVATNRNFYGSPIYQEDDSGLAKLSKISGAVAGQMSHPWIRTGLELVTDQRSLKEALPGMLEVPLYPSASSDVAHLKGKQIQQFKDLYEQNPEGAYQFSEAKKQAQELGDQKKELEEKYNPKDKTWLESLFSPKQAKAMKKDSISTDNKVMYWDDEAQSVKTIDFAKYTEEAPSDPIKKIRFEGEKFDKAMEIYRAETDTLNDQDKEAIFKKLGVSSEDLSYYDIASGSDYESSQIRRMFVSQYIATIPEDQDKLEALALLRKEVRGSRILSDNNINELVDEGVLSSAEGKYLKSIQWDEKSKTVKKSSKAGKKISIKETPIPSRQLSTGGAKVPLIQFNSTGGRSRLSSIPEINLSSTTNTNGRIKLKKMNLPSIKLKPTYFQGLKI